MTSSVEDTASLREDLDPKSRLIDIRKRSHLTDNELQQAICQQDLHVKVILRKLFKCTDSKTFAEMNSEFMDATTKHRFLIEELEKRCKYGSAQSKEILSAELEALRYQLESNLKNQKKAILEGRETIKQAERRRLFGGPEKEEEMRLRNRKDRVKYSAQNAQKLTEDLFRIRSLLAQQCEQGKLSLEAASIASENISQIRDEFNSMGGVVAQSRALLNKYGRREITEFILLFLSHVFLYATCAYVTWKRW